MIPVEKALEVVLANAHFLGSEEVDLADAHGRFLAEDVAADLDIPPFDRAMMDGYALRAADTAPAPAVLRVAGQLRAGQVSGAALGAGQAIEIMTGAPVPSGADAVQQVEKTRSLPDGRVEIGEAVEPGQNVAPRGCEVHAGAVVLEIGRRIDAAAVAVLATAGRVRVRVGRRPRVAFLVTGDELVDPSVRPAGGQIRNANGPAVLAQIHEAGALAEPLGISPDDAERIAAAVQRGIDADVLVLSGGVSAGAFDLVEAVLARFDVEVFFERVAIKPGAPLVFGRRGRTLVFGLPGNPVSAMVTFDVFVRSALERLQGAPAPPRPLVEVVLEGPAKNRSRRKAYLPAIVRPAGAQLLAAPVRSAGSADVFAHARANALVVLEADRTEARAGERAPAMLLRRFVHGETP